VFSKKHRGKNTRPGSPVHDDLVGRNFTAHAPNELWLADITEHRTIEGKLYVCAIKDVFSNRIVGYSIDSRMISRIAVNALNNAVARRGDVAGCIVHTDRGSQFRSRKHIRALSRHGMVGSMGRVGAAGDNAAMESSSLCCKTTSWIGKSGPPASSYALRSSPGSNAPTTDAAGKTASADCPPSNSRPR